MSRFIALLSPRNSSLALALTYFCVAVLLLYPTTFLGQSGTPSFSAYDPHPVDTISLQNLNVLVTAPVYSQSGAFPLSINFSANSYCTHSGLVYWACGAQSPSVTDFGAITENTFLGSSWAGAFPLAFATMLCADHVTVEFSYSQWAIRDANGTFHPLPPTDSVLSGGTSACRHTSFTDTTIDGSGLTTTVTGSSSGYSNSPIVTPGGVTIATTSITDSNSNVVSIGATQYYGSLSSSTAAATASPSVSNPTSVSWTDVNTGSPAVSVTMSNVKWQTNFGCTGITDVPPGSSTPEISGLSYPDGSSLGITYEATSGKPGYVTGRIGQLTLRTGGTITYTYTTSCTGQVTQLVRTTADGTTTYSSSTDPTTGAVTTRMTDNGGNVTVYIFSTPNAYGQAGLIEVQHNLGSSGPLKTDTYCYNNTTACQNPVTFPVTSLSVSTTVGTQTRQSSYTYDRYGNVLTDAEYDFTATSPTLTTTTVYGSWNGGTSSCGAVSTTIKNKPCTVVETNGSNTVAQSEFTYDSKGDLLTRSIWTGNSSGTQWLTSHATYNSNGTVATSTDPAGNIASYNYNGTGGCSGLFPTSSVAGGMTTYETWNCTGGVQVASTDANGSVATYGYENSSGVADPFWRISSVTDPLGNETLKNYTPRSTNITLTFNGANSTINVTSIVDAYGRPINNQRQQGPTATQYDTTSSEYGWNTSGGHIYKSVTTTQPCFEPSGTECGFSSATTQTLLDPLGRPYTVTDGGGGTITKTYQNNDVLSVRGPITAGENAKSAQTEYDGLGRVKSICGIMVTGGYTSCSQNSGSYSGQFTTYSYSYAPGSSTTTVTRGVQPRSKTFDALGRVVSSTTPEGGVVTNTYDYQSGAPCAGTYSYPGHLVLKKVANGNFECYDYDGLGRLWDISAGYSGGGATACVHFQYDNSTGVLGAIPTGITVSNVYGRMVEAATDNCVLPRTLTTDEWFSYDKDGHVTDMWELTPNSGQYYHSKATFYGNGVVDELTLSSPNLFSSTYKLDGEGRWNQMTTFGQTIVPASGVTFNAASQPTVIDIGTGTDNDSYTYDPNTGRMTNWVFTVGTKNESAVLNWNANWTLGNLQITDGFNAGGTQTCYFNPSGGSTPGYDDLGRLLNDNCPSVWAQTFSYDQYNNISKSGSITWACSTCYNPSTNQYNGGVGRESYDGNGDLTSDPNNIYAWNEFGKLKSVNVDGTNCTTSGQCLVYDALGRVVEIDNGGSRSEIWYTQLGKTVYMNGAAFSYVYWPTPGGGTLLQNYGTGGDSLYFQHKDWLGSSRISSTLGTTIIDDRAFAPYGEIYDNFGSTSANENMFTGDTQDILATLDCCFDTPNREQSSTQGRWLSPDPAGSGWNQYAYAANPNSFVDPTGLYLCFPAETNSGSGCGSLGGGSSGGGGNGSSWGSNGGFDLGNGNGFDNNNGTVLADGTVATIGPIGPGYSGVWGGNGIALIGANSGGILNMSFGAGATMLMGLPASLNNFDIAQINNLGGSNFDFSNAQDESLAFNLQVEEGIVFPVGAIGELPSFLGGYEAPQGFSGVIDSSTGDVAVRPSTYGEIPDGWVNARGGHFDVSQELGSDPTNQSGFAMKLQDDGSVAVTFKSGTLNAGPDALASPEVQQQIIQWIQQQGVTVYKP